MRLLLKEEADVLPGGMASKEASMGILGNKDVMDVPFQTTTLTEKTITTFGGPNQPLQSVLINNPAVRSVGTTLHNDFSIRGLKSTGSSLYVNGIPGLMTQFWAPSYVAEDIQFISGPNSGISGLPSSYETSSAGGIVTLFLKKPQIKILTVINKLFLGKVR